jgi:hypothetical protein
MTYTEQLIDQLETALGEFDHALQEGVIFTKEQKDKAVHFAGQLRNITTELNYTNDAGKLVIGFLEKAGIEI